MKSCAANDPQRLKTVDDLLALVRRIGFLPLFESGITGFSVEERTAAASWWTGDADTDPWEWRIMLSANPEIAYGKFFDKKAGFIHKDFFPVFANYRRNGYDFEALFDDELASYRAKRIMDAFELNDEAVGKEIMSNDLKYIAGFGKDGGEKNFNGIFTELQMQTYLIMSDFKQKKNKKGEAYGWHIAVMETPETKWGYDFTTSAYSEKPSDSWKKITAQVLRFFPNTNEKQIRKLLAIKYPGTETQPAEKKKSVPKPKKTVPTYPYNLLKDISDDMPDTLNEDQMEGLRYAVSTLKPNEQKVIIMRYEENKAQAEIGKILNLSNSRVGQIKLRALRKLRHPNRINRIKFGFVGEEQRMPKLKEDCKNANSRAEQIKLLKNVFFSDFAVSYGIHISMYDHNISTLGGLMEIMDRDLSELADMLHNNEEFLAEVFQKLEEYHVDCSKAKAATLHNRSIKKEHISELDLSCRTYNNLIRSGFDSIEQLKALIRDDPKRLLQIKGLGKKSIEELLSKLEDEGIDVSAVRKLL